MTPLLKRFIPRSARPDPGRVGDRLAVKKSYRRAIHKTAYWAVHTLKGSSGLYEKYCSVNEPGPCRGDLLGAIRGQRDAADLRNSGYTAWKPGSHLRVGRSIMDIWRSSVEAAAASQKEVTRLRALCPGAKGKRSGAGETAAGTPDFDWRGCNGFQKTISLRRSPAPFLDNPLRLSVMRHPQAAFIMARTLLISSGRCPAFRPCMWICRRRGKMPTTSIPTYVISFSTLSRPHPSRANPRTPSGMCWIRSASPRSSPNP